MSATLTAVVDNSPGIACNLLAKFQGSKAFYSPTCQLTHCPIRNTGRLVTSSSSNLETINLSPIVLYFMIVLPPKFLRHTKNLVDQCGQFPQIRVVVLLPTFDGAGNIFYLRLLKRPVTVVGAHELGSLRYPELRCDVSDLKMLMKDSGFDFKG